MLKKTFSCILMINNYYLATHFFIAIERMSKAGMSLSEERGQRSDQVRQALSRSCPKISGFNASRLPLNHDSVHSSIIGSNTETECNYRSNVV